MWGIHLGDGRYRHSSGREHGRNGIGVDSLHPQPMTTRSLATTGQNCAGQAAWCVATTDHHLLLKLAAR